MIRRIYAASRAILEKIERRHRVEFGEIVEVFSNPHIIRKSYTDQYGQRRYFLLGRTDAGRYLTVWFVFERSDEVKVLTARDMDDKERKMFQRGKR